MKNTPLIIAGIAIVLLALAWGRLPHGASTAANPHSAALTDSKSADTESAETVIVLSNGEQSASPLVAERACGASPLCKNGVDGINVVVLKSGIMPKQKTMAVVKTDTNCDPDAYGISHCSNILELSDGSLIEVQHDHNMQLYPCLDPGDSVTVESQPSVS